MAMTRPAGCLPRYVTATCDGGESSADSASHLYASGVCPVLSHRSADDDFPGACADRVIQGIDTTGQTNEDDAAAELRGHGVEK